MMLRITEWIAVRERRMRNDRERGSLFYQFFQVVGNVLVQIKVIQSLRPILQVKDEAKRTSRKRRTVVMRA
jgi:hypothetical protein